MDPYNHLTKTFGSVFFLLLSRNVNIIIKIMNKKLQGTIQAVNLENPGSLKKSTQICTNSQKKRQKKDLYKQKGIVESVF